MSARVGAGAVLSVLLLAAPAAVRAQPPEYDTGGLGRHVATGGEMTAVIGERDDTAFFNYSDYERNVLRIARLRLFGEWRASSRLSAIGELRTENDAVMLPALYLRWRPAATPDLFVHAGRIPPVIGGFARHAYGRDNIVIGQPLAYQYLTLLRPDAVPATVDDIIRMRGRGWQPSFPVGATSVAAGVPLVSASRWDTGGSLIWRRDPFELAGAVTRGSPALPVVDDGNDGLMWSGRGAARLPRGVVVGVSAARGQWLDDEVLDLTPDGRSAPAAQSLVGIDMELNHGPWLVRGEWLRTAFDLPVTERANPHAALHAWAAFAEARVRPLPRWQIGARVDRLAFGAVPDRPSTTWDASVSRLEVVAGFRATRHIELRAGWQHNWRDGGRVRERGLPVFAFLGWF